MLRTQGRWFEYLPSSGWFLSGIKVWLKSSPPFLKIIKLAGMSHRLLGGGNHYIYSRSLKGTNIISSPLLLQLQFIIIFHILCHHYIILTRLHTEAFRGRICFPALIEPSPCISILQTLSLTTLWSLWVSVEAGIQDEFPPKPFSFLYC